MKKIIIGGIVGGILIFIWQSLSWMALDLHRPSQQYTAKQDTIMAALNAHLTETGGYLLPTIPKGASMEEWEKSDAKAKGKPWAQISYHKSFEMNMGKSMAMNIAGDILAAMLLCWIVTMFKAPAFGNVFATSLAVGVLAFLFEPFTTHAWYPIIDIAIYFVDALAAWGLAGIWFGWYLPKK